MRWLSYRRHPLHARVARASPTAMKPVASAAVSAVVSAAAIIVIIVRRLLARRYFVRLDIQLRRSSHRWPSLAMVHSSLLQLATVRHKVVAAGSYDVRPQDQSSVRLRVRPNWAGRVCLPLGRDRSALHQLARSGMCPRVMTSSRSVRSFRRRG